MNYKKVGEVRYQVSNAFKTECKSNFAANRQGKIHVIEDNVDISGENYDGKLVSFKIEDSCYTDGNFIGSAIAKKIIVSLINDENPIELENKKIKPYAGINNEYVPFSTFIIEKPENDDYSKTTTFTGYDYMIKFQKPFVDNNTYPTTLGTFLTNLCAQVGVTLGTTTFVNSDYIVEGNPFTNNEQCLVVLKSIAKLAGGFAYIGRDDKLYIKNVNEPIDALTVGEVHAIKVSELNETLIKYLGKSREGQELNETLDGNVYSTLKKNLMYGEVNKITLKLNPDLIGEDVSIQDDASITQNGLTEIIITENYFLTNEDDRNKTIENIWEKLKYLKYLPYKIEEYYGFPYLDIGDAIEIIDSEDNSYRSYILGSSFEFNGSFKGSVEAPALTKVQEQYKPKNDLKNKVRKAEISIDKINGEIALIVEEQDEEKDKSAQLRIDVDGITSEVHNSYSTTEQMRSEIEQSAGSIISSVSKTYSTKEETTGAKNEAINSANNTTDAKLQNYSTTTQMNTAISQKANEITSNVSTIYITKTDSTTNINTAKNEAISSANSDTDDKLKNYSTTVQMNSAINQKANSIEFNVSKIYSTKEETTDAINDINIGGRNLQLGSADWNDTAWLTKTGVTISEDTATVAKGNRPTCNPIEVKPGDILTISVDIKSTVSYTDTAGICLDFLNSNKTRATNVDWKPLSITTEWQRMSKTFTVPDNNQIKYFAVGLRSSSTQTNSFRHLKVERGNKATDWTPAPEDIDEELGGKLNEEDFTGANIILAINNGTSSATINADKISLDGKEIDLTAGNITIDSDNFSVDKNGNISATSGKIGGFTLGVNSFIANLVSEKMEYPYDSNDLTRIRNIILGNITPTTEDYNKYDLNDDGTIDAIDLLIVFRIINGYYDGRAVFELNTKKSEEAISIKNSSGKRVVNLGVFGSYLQQITADKIYADSIECDNLMVGNTEILGEQTLYSTSVAINSSSYKTLTGMPDLTEYIGRTVNIYIKYNGDQARKYSFVAGSSSYFAEYVRDFNGNDMWHTLFKIENTNSTSWKITTANSYVVSSSGIAQINITDSNYMFYIEKITIN